MRSVVSTLAILGSAACASTVYDDTDTDGPPPNTPGEAWAEVRDLLDAETPVGPGMTLVVIDRSGTVRFRHTVGEFEPDVRVPVASASKLVTALTLLAVVERGDLALRSTTAEVLGWTGDHSDISLDHAGAFVTGLPAEHLCTRQTRITLADCAEALSTSEATASTGARFDYGSTHMAVAGRMAEVATGRRWNQIFTDELATPLGLTDPGLEYVTYPKQGTGGDNPLLAGGLLTTVDEYQRMLLLVLGEGEVDGTRILAADRVNRLFENPHSDAIIGASPTREMGLDYRYGFGAWLECDGAMPTCDVINSAGSYGFTPWIDRANGYAGILAMEGPAGTAGSSMAIQQRLRPLVEHALQE